MAREDNKIKNSKYRDEVDSMLNAGFTIEAIKRYLEFQYGFTVSRETFYTYRDKYFVPDFTKKVLQALVDMKTAARYIDIIAARTNLIHLHSERIRLAMDKEKQITIPLKSTDEMIKVFNELLDSLKDDYQSSGFMEVSKLAVALEGLPLGENGGNKLNDLFEGIPKDERSKIASVVGRDLVEKLKAARKVNSVKDGSGDFKGSK